MFKNKAFSALLYLMLLLTKRSQFLDFSFSFCRAARLIEMIQVSYFFAIRYHPGVKIVTCHSVSSRGPAPRFNLDNDQLPGPRPRHSHLLNILPVRVSSWPRHSPGCRDEKCERGEKIPSWALASRLRLVCVSIGWSWENFVMRISSHLTREPGLSWARHSHG